MSLRHGLRRLSTGLLIYGAVGLGVAVIGLMALLYVGGRLGALNDRVEVQVESLIETLDRTATVLDDAGSSALSFAVTLERTPPTVRQAAQTVSTLQGTMRSIEGQLGAISILGQQPLGNVAGLFGQMATDLEGLDTRLELIADDLSTNRDRLLANAASLDALGEQVATVAERLRSGGIEESFADVTSVVTLLALLLSVWTAVPAVGALALGWWLRRELGVDDA
ncbi:MAG TPA: hypothetical protein VD763_08325 [Candidatus Saccharimonadales bacterium]|nr:hypothetical protein [Candidatus Saccharimonadales bacterium]